MMLEEYKIKMLENYISGKGTMIICFNKKEKRENILKLLEGYDCSLSDIGYKILLQWEKNLEDYEEVNIKDLVLTNINNDDYMKIINNSEYKAIKINYSEFGADMSMSNHKNLLFMQDKFTNILEYPVIVLREYIRYSPFNKILTGGNVTHEINPLSEDKQAHCIFYRTKELDITLSNLLNKLNFNIREALEILNSTFIIDTLRKFDINEENEDFVNMCEEIYNELKTIGELNDSVILYVTKNIVNKYSNK